MTEMDRSKMIAQSLMFSHFMENPVGSPIRFTDFPLHVQHKIFSYMDVKSFFRTAISSKKMRRIAEKYDDKHWADVDICEQEDGRRYFCEGSNATKRFAFFEEFSLLFHGSTVRKLTLHGQAPMYSAVYVRAHEIELNFRCDSLFGVLELHKPEGKYRSVSIEQPVRPIPEFLKWLNEWTDAVRINPSAPISEYTSLKMPQIWLETTEVSASQLEAYGKAVLLEWRTNRREIHLITLPTRFDIYPPVFLTEYQRIYRAPDYQTVYFRIKRVYGDVLIVRFRLSQNIVEIADLEHIEIDADAEDKLIEFVFNE